MNPIPSSPLNMNLAIPAGVNATTGSAGSAAATAGSAAADGGLGSTFLSLLSQELQNQDPTAPVDSTAMVGQMISLNQLDQLINIAKSVQGLAAGTGNPTAPTGNSAAQPVVAQHAGPAAVASPAVRPGTAASGSYQLPFDPNTMLPVDMLHPAGAALTLDPAAAPASTIR